MTGTAGCIQGGADDAPWMNNNDRKTKATSDIPDYPEHPTWWYLSRKLDTRTIIMRSVAVCLASLVALMVPADAQKRIDAINTNFRWLGPDDKIVVERYDDPKVANVSCYLSRAETGGIKGGLGFAEDPSRFSIACRAVGPITVPPGLAKSEVIGFSSASLFFKTFQIHRAVDPEKNVLIYTVVSTRLIAGSPFNSISVVPAGVP